MKLLVTTAVLILGSVLVQSLSHSSKSFYQILGVDQTASKRDIKLAYINTAKRYRKQDGYIPKAKMKEWLNELTEASIAGAVLINDEKRRIYDEYGENGFCWTPFWECH